MGLLAVGICHTFNYNRDTFIRADDVVRWESERARLATGLETMTAQAPMNAAMAAERAYHLAEAEYHDHASGPGGTILGFWIYLMSDALIFAALVATFGVLGTSYAAGPAPREVFELPLVALNTDLLLLSSIAFGLGMLEMEARRLRGARMWLVITALLVLGFVAIELHEFAG